MCNRLCFFEVVLVIDRTNYLIFPCATKLTIGSRVQFDKIAVAVATHGQCLCIITCNLCLLEGISGKRIGSINCIICFSLLIIYIRQTVSSDAIDNIALLINGINHLVDIAQHSIIEIPYITSTSSCCLTSFVIVPPTIGVCGQSYIT